MININYQIFYNLLELINYSYNLIEPINFVIAYLEPIIIIIFILGICFMTEGSLQIALAKYRLSKKIENNLNLTPLEWKLLFQVQYRSLRYDIRIRGIQNSAVVLTNLPAYRLAYDEAMFILHTELGLMGGSISILKGTLSLNEEIKLMQLITKSGTHFSAIVD